MATYPSLSEEELEFIAENPWIRVDPAPLAQEILALRAELKAIRAVTRVGEEWSELLGCPPASKL